MLLGYLLRNPLYGNILKSKILMPILDIVFGKFNSIKNLIIYFIELRCSLAQLI
jgi:hypothetical protein